MLRLEFPECDFWDEVHEEFVTQKKVVLQLEHSLVSVSKWEAKWHKPFLDRIQKTPEETIDYIRCMTITQNVDPMIYKRIDNKTVEYIKEYIADSRTATWFSEDKKNPSREIITSEIIYYWMIALNIPFECQKWHLNRLLTLIQVCNIKNNPNKKKMSRNELLRRNTDLNKARRKALNTKG